MISIWTDGGAAIRLAWRPGSWAYLIERDGDVIVENSGGEYHTTNNRMEMMGVIEGLDHAAEARYFSERIRVYSDSKYVVMGVTQWIRGWRANNWRTYSGAEVANRDLWEMLAGRVENHGQVEFYWVRGHAGVELNERVDAACTRVLQGLKVTPPGRLRKRPVMRPVRAGRKSPSR